MSVNPAYKVTIYLRTRERLTCTADRNDLRAFQQTVNPAFAWSKLVGTCGTSIVIRPEAIEAIESEPMG